MLRLKKSILFPLTFSLIIFSIVFHVWNKSRVNPYSKEGLEITWHVGGASSAYPWIEVWVTHHGNRVKPDLKFGGIEYPRLRFRDHDGDGLKDIIFEDDDLMQVVAFFPKTEQQGPRFEVLRNDIDWP